MPVPASDSTGLEILAGDPHGVIILLQRRSRRNRAMKSRHGYPSASSVRGASGIGGLHDNLSDHVRMQRAEVIVFAWRYEGEREFIISVQRLRPERLVLRHDRVRDIVLI